MIKSKVNHNRVAVAPYPKLVLNDDIGLIILAVRETSDSSFCGVVLKGGDGVNIEGDVRNDWKRLDFQDFQGEITLSNGAYDE